MNKTLHDTVHKPLPLAAYRLRLFWELWLLLNAGYSYFIPDQYGIKNYLEETQMKYRVYRFEINMEKDQNKLEEFLNNLKGEVVAIIPNNSKMSFLQIYGVSSKINFLFIVVKLN